jgi:predicted XRE-type DNA-binding protein
MKDKFIRGFKKLLMDRDIQQKELAALLGLSESVFSKKLKDPFSAFTESQIRIIKFYTDSSVNGVMADISIDKKWKKETAAAIFSHDLVTYKLLKSITWRLAQMETDISEIKLLLKENKN